MSNARRHEALRSASRLCAAILVLLVGATAEVARGQSLDWAKRAGGPNFDQGLAIAADDAGNSYVTGFFSGSATFGSGGVNETTLIADARDVFVAKYDPTGALVWVRQARGADPSHGQGNAISVDAAGNAYVTGVFRFAMTFAEGTTLSEFIPGVTDLFVAKYDANGNFVWARQAGLNFIPGVVSIGKAGNGISVDNAGNSHVTGLFGTELGEGAFFLAKFDASGSLLWAKHASNDGVNPSAAGGTAISVDSTGHSYVTGNFSGSIAFGPQEPNETILTAEGGYDFFAAKYDDGGSLVWVKRAGGSAVSGSGIDVDAAGNVFATGGFSGSIVFGPGEPNETTLTGLGVLNFFVAKFDNGGSLAWARTASGSADGSAISVDAAGNSHVTGLFGSFLVLGPGEPNETTLNSAAIYNEAFLAKYDSSGALLWARQSVGPYTASGRGVSVDGTGAAYVAGIFGNVGGNAGDPTSVIFGLGEANQTTLTTATGSGTEIFIARFSNGTTNRPPIADDQTVNTQEDTPVAITLTASDPDGTPVTYAILVPPAHGQLTGTPPNVTYTPDPNFYGDDFFTFTASDGSITSLGATVTIHVAPVNDVPVAVNDAASTDRGVAVTISVLSNDTDVDGDPRAVTSVGPAPTGSVQANTNGTVTYTPPNRRFTGVVSFPYTISDGHGGTATAMVTVTVQAPNSPPRASTDRVTTMINTPIVIDVLANDSDPDGDALQVTAVTQPGSGAAALNPDQTITYTPNAGFTGRDTFTYTIADGRGGTDTGQIVVTVRR